MNSSQNKIHQFGIKSKYGEFIFNHPWFSMLLLYAVSGLLLLSTGEERAIQIRGLSAILLAFLLCAAFVRFAHRNACFKIVVNLKNETIKLHRVFNKGVVTAALSEIKVLIDRNINIVIDGNKYKIFNESFEGVASVLPPNTKVEFRGLLGKTVETEWQREGKSYPFWP